jgi:hypothetical protein
MGANPEPRDDRPRPEAMDVDVPRADAAIILSVTIILVAFILIFLFQTPALLGSGLPGE